jgi:hypothetical protein
MELFFGEGVIHDALGGRVDPDIGDCIEPAPELTVEIIEIAGARAMRGDVGNMPTLPGVFPDYFAPIVRNSAEGRERAGACLTRSSRRFTLRPCRSS